MGLFRKKDDAPGAAGGPVTDRKAVKATRKQNKRFCPGCGAKNDLSEHQRCRLCGSLLVSDVSSGGITGLAPVDGTDDVPGEPVPSPDLSTTSAEPGGTDALAVPGGEAADAGYLIPAGGQRLSQDATFDEGDGITFDPDEPFDPDALLSEVELPGKAPDPPPPPPPPTDEAFDPDALEAGWPAPSDGRS